MPWALSWIKIFRLHKQLWSFSTELFLLSKTELLILLLGHNLRIHALLLCCLNRFSRHIIYSYKKITWFDQGLFQCKREFHSPWGSPMHWRPIFLKISSDSIGRYFWLTVWQYKTLFLTTFPGNLCPSTLDSILWVLKQKYFC